MRDDSLTPTAVLPTRQKKGLLFPATPQPGETLPGFIVRCVSQNHLGTPVQFMRQVGLDLSGDYLRRLQASQDLVARAVGLMKQDLEGLWGVELPEADGRRRLGGVFLRPDLVEQSRRRVPPSVKSGDCDDARWMIRPFGFCPRTWEVLVDRCPNKWCSKPLTWPMAEAIDRCRHCGTPTSEALRISVPPAARPALSWVASLFSECDATRMRAMSKVPVAFDVHTETDVFELLLAFRRAWLLLNKHDVAEDKGVNLPPSHVWAAWQHAAQFMLDYPRSLWDEQQDLSQGKRFRLHQIWARIRRDTRIPLVRQQLGMILAEGDEPNPLRVAPMFRRLTEEKVPTSILAAHLGVQPGTIAQLVDADFLVPLPSTGGKRKLFHASDARRIRNEIELRISWRRFTSATKLPRIAIEQLLASGGLLPFESPMAELIYCDRQLQAAVADDLIDRLNRLPALEGAEQWLPLSEAFRGVGGRDKPWAPVVMAAINGELDGLIGWPRFSPGGSLMINPTTARTLIMGGPEATTWFSFEAGDYGRYYRDWLKPGEVIERLNCSAVDLRYLEAQGHLWPTPKAEKTIYRREYVDEFSRMWMTTREAAARLGVEPRHVWQTLERHHMRNSLGNGFHQRDELEPLVAMEVVSQRSRSRQRRVGPRE